MCRSTVAVAWFAPPVPPQYKFSDSYYEVKAFLLPLWGVSGIEMDEREWP